MPPLAIDQTLALGRANCPLGELGRPAQLLAQVCNRRLALIPLVISEMDDKRFGGQPQLLPAKAPSPGDQAMEW